MAEKNNNAVPHGAEQNIKMELLGMIHSGESPYLIIDHVARYLEAVSDEPGYADHVRENLRSVYGCALLQKRLLTDELKDVAARLKKLKKPRPKTISPRKKRPGSASPSPFTKGTSSG